MLQQAIRGNSVLLRCPVVSACWEEPTPGYCEHYDKLCEFYQMAGLGYLQALRARRETLLDMVPGDLLANLAILCGTMRGPEVVNYSTLGRNPVSMGQLVDTCNAYFREYPLSGRSASLGISESESWLALQHLRRQLPLIAKFRLGKMLSLQKLKVENSIELKKIRKAQQLANESEAHLEAGWLMETSKAAELHARLQGADRQRFPFEPSLIHWEHYLRHAIYGLRHFILKERLERPAKSGDSNLIALKSNYFEDLYWAFTNGVDHSPPDAHFLRKQVLASRGVREAVRQIVAQRKEKLNLPPTSDYTY